MKASILACAMLLLAAARASSADLIFGEWWTPGFNARVVIYECGNQACGSQRHRVALHEYPGGQWLRDALLQAAGLEKV